ncbi:hypothetical protein E3N88_06951 [Mikania micrantha]|uniref:Uncharacterized protein n=1 Tax=Mikania micrantha TaxID=192012 RepID=A0A5N6PS75_9ASTR|nr:hypothetical protein E3N88_06951 [Mikania micrantha]
MVSFKDMSLSAMKSPREKVSSPPGSSNEPSLINLFLRDRVTVAHGRSSALEEFNVPYGRHNFHNCARFQWHVCWSSSDANVTSWWSWCRSTNVLWSKKDCENYFGLFSRFLIYLYYLFGNAWISLFFLVPAATCSMYKARWRSNAKLLDAHVSARSVGSRWKACGCSWAAELATTSSSYAITVGRMEGNWVDHWLQDRSGCCWAEEAKMGPPVA